MILGNLQRLGFRPDEIVLLASHTHCAPATDQACARLGIPEVEFVDDVAEAAENLVRQIQTATTVGDQPGGFPGAAEPLHQPPPLLAVSDLWTNLRVQADAACSFAPNPSGPKDERATVALLREAG